MREQQRKPDARLRRLDVPGAPLILVEGEPSGMMPVMEQGFGQMDEATLQGHLRQLIPVAGAEVADQGRVAQDLAAEQAVDRPAPAILEEHGREALGGIRRRRAVEPIVPRDDLAAVVVDDLDRGVAERPVRVGLQHRDATLEKTRVV